jgi:hypothetical protein
MKSNCWSVLLHREADGNDGPPQRAPFRHLLGAATNALLRETDSAYRAITNEHYLQCKALRDLLNRRDGTSKLSPTCRRKIS